MTAPEPSDPGGTPQPDEQIIGAGGDPLVLAERRARRAELAEQQARERLAEADARVAQLEHATSELQELRERLADRAKRDAALATVVAQAAAATRAARESLDREIGAREAAEVALVAERAAREASEQAVVAERAARDALASALVAERARAAQASALAAGASLHGFALPPLPGISAIVSAPVPAATAAPVPPATPAAHPDLTPTGGALAGETDALIAGLARAAERLRAQIPQPAPEAAEAAPQAIPQAVPQAAPAPVAAPAPPRRGGLLRALERALRGRP